jgi:hypothetical protein
MATQDRKVAEWVLFEGGELSLEGNPARIQDVSALPSGDFFIETLDLVGTLIEPPQLERISGLTRLRNLYLAGPMWNRNADDGKDHSADLRAIAGITSLERITFSYHFLDRTRFRDAGLTAINSLTNLRELSVRQANVRGHSLSPFHKLQVLDVTLAPVDDDGLGNVGGMPELQRLWVGDTLISDSGLSALSRLRNLVDLDLHGTQVSDLGLSQIAGLKQLRKINLMGTRVTDDGLEVLRGFPQLEYLNLYRTRVTNAGLDRLKPLANLREIDLRYTRVSRAGVDSLRSTLSKTSFVFIDSCHGRRGGNERRIPRRRQSRHNSSHGRADCRPQGTHARPQARYLRHRSGRSRSEAPGRPRNAQRTLSRWHSGLRQRSYEPFEAS